MYQPYWFFNIYEKFAHDHDCAWYKRWFFIGIIDPVDDFFCWWGRRVLDPWHDAKNAYLRVKQGYDYSDVWNMNDWFINGAVGILETWLETEDCPMGSPVVDGETGEAMNYDEWIGILNEMLEGFKLWQTYEGGGEFPEIVPDIYDSGTHHFSRCIFDKKPSESCWKDGAHYMTFEGVWHKCSMTTEEYKKYEKALALFAKYHATLWD